MRRAEPGRASRSTIRRRWHRILMAVVVALLTLAVAFYVLSIVLAPSQGGSFAGLFDGWAMFSLIGAIAVGVVDFFVRPFAGRSGSPEERAAAATKDVSAARRLSR